jgi:hypothetical protein
LGDLIDAVMNRVVCVGVFVIKSSDRRQQSVLLDAIRVLLLARYVRGAFNVVQCLLVAKYVHVFRMRKGTEGLRVRNTICIFIFCEVEIVYKSKYGTVSGVAWPLSAGSGSSIEPSFNMWSALDAAARPHKLRAQGSFPKQKV